MLHSYAFSNFQSFHDRVEVDLRLSRKVTLTEWMHEVPTGERVSKLMAVIGPNGSGKTALVKPLAFLAWFLRQSFQNTPDAKIPVAPHFAHADEPTELECVVDFDGTLWRYVLRCTQDRVLHEALYRKRERFNYVFVRDWDSSIDTYQIKQQDFGLSPHEARKVRQNVSLISWAAQYDVPLAKRLANVPVVSNVNVLGRVFMGNDHVLAAAQHFFANQDQYKKMEQLLTAWDMGLAGVELQEIAVNNPQTPGQPLKVKAPFGRHKSHGKDFILPLTLESSGTQGAFVLLSWLLTALETGGLAIIDEFENDLHPHMLEPILDLFANPKTNPGNAQLLFTCHAIEVLNIVHKSQVMLVQKNDECESTACRMDAVSGIRNDDNYYAKYMAGAYGAVPVL